MNVENIAKCQTTVKSGIALAIFLLVASLLAFAMYPQVSLGAICLDLSPSSPLGQARVITAKVPLSELFGFTTQLRSLTEGRGVPNLEFSHYAIVPRNVQEEIIASRK